MPRPSLPASPGLLVLLAGLALPIPAHAEEPDIPKTCRSRKGLGLLVSPEAPSASSPLRVVVVSERPQTSARLVAEGPGGTRLALEAAVGGGPPYHWVATLPRPTAGLHRFALLASDGQALACGRVRVEPRPPRVALPGREQWPVRRSWTRYTENLYAVWIEKLFDAPAGQQPSWTPLHQVIHDPARNILWNHLGAEEDGPDPKRAVVVKPDCADLPYFLRAYFSFKLGLPFGYRHCDRGSSTQPTRCEKELRTNLSTAAEGSSLALRFSRFLRQNVGLVHSGSGRTAPDDDETDLYPVALSRGALRPGVVYVDPYGHLLVIAKWVEATSSRGGILYAVDGHPDLSVGRKRFWRGAFLFSDKIQGGAGGFKAFRPLRVRGGVVVAMGNDEIGKHPDYRNPSAEQYQLGIEGFYDRMERIINPRPLPALQLYGERLDALYELIQERVGSVQVGEDYVRKTGGAEIAMPEGPKIFETRAAWEDYSTPARDMRLLIAIEEVMRYPRKVEERPDRVVLPRGQSPGQARRELEALYGRFTKSKTFTYQRSDGAPWTLTVGELIARRKGLEMAYNPNDCAEIRWAAEGKELGTCNRHASDAQRRRMARYRVWFATRTRPPLR